KTFQPLNLQTYCLTIAASDTSGGAGIQRDLKTFQDIGVYGLSVITGITAQNFENVFFAKPLDKNQIEIQLKTVLENFPISATKIGVVFNHEIMKLIMNYLMKFQIKNIVIDPIISASDGSIFLQNSDIKYLKEKFLVLADLVTPNVPELEILSEKNIKSEKDIISNAKKLSQKYNASIFVKGGHLKNNQRTIKDFLVRNNYAKIFGNQRKRLSQKHGTGCMISSAITAYLAEGLSIENSITKAKEYFKKSQI
ncbi:MAG: bifunctional hydroxymethylpyrimidine kinase/phosphomethylpyrimidine kinase, partial [Candidatus Cloacimonetes bacterium]|nr:bifunctional hydroxymethylpyrimidine kinase/phosphomethylpyrimidine kinase [Candidatus Cloacimonadota bacterium]